MSAKSKVASSQEAQPSRRNFFVGVGVAAGAVAAVSQTPVGKAVIQEIGGAKAVKDAGQSITAHMRKYYESTLI